MKKIIFSLCLLITAMTAFVACSAKPEDSTTETSTEGVTTTALTATASETVSSQSTPAPTKASSSTEATKVQTGAVPLSEPYTNRYIVEGPEYDPFENN